MPTPPSGRASDRIDLALKLFVALTAALIAINIAVWLRTVQPAPYTDMIDVEWLFAHWSLERDGLGPIVTYTDNEHRSLVPLLLQALDHNLFATTGFFLVLVHIACFAGLAAAFARHAALSFETRPRLALAAATAMTLVMLWSAHWNNIIRTKQTHMCVALISMALAFWLLARIDAMRARETRVPWAPLLGAGVLLVNAAWSFAAGVATLPAAIVFVLVRPWRWSARAVVIGACAFAAGTRAWASAVAGSATGGVIEPGGAGPLGFVLYSLNFLGGLSRAALGGDEFLAPLLAAAALVLAAPLIVMSFRPSARAGAGLTDGGAQAASFFTLTLIWSLICMAGIAPFRAGFGADQAFAPRYLPFSVVFIVSTVMLAALFRSALPAWTRRAVQIVSVVYLVAIAITSPRGWLLAAEHERRVALGAVAATLGVDDPQYALYPALAGGRLPQLMALYREDDDAFFRRDWGGWLGAPADEAFEMGSDEDCASVAGAVALAPLGGGGYRVAAHVEGGAPFWVAIVDAEGHVAGLARRGESAPPLADATHAGVARLDGPTAARALAIGRDGRACALDLQAS